MSILATASVLYGMIYGYTPISRRNHIEFVTFVCLTTPIYTLKALSLSNSHSSRLVALMGAPIVSSIAISTGYLIGKAAANATATATATATPTATEPPSTGREL